MEKPSFENILKCKIDYYGQTEAAYEFASEEYARQTFNHMLDDMLVEQGRWLMLTLPRLKRVGFLDWFGNPNHIFTSREDVTRLLFNLI